MYDLRIKLTRAQHEFVKAKSAMDAIDMQDVIRVLIEKAYDNERRNGVDIVRLAKENGLL